MTDVTASQSFRFDDDDDAHGAPAAPPAAPIELTASDGTGLVLVSMAARIVVDDPLAFTELHLVFENPEARQLEGRFRIALPPGASVSRFAMRIGDALQEGEVVERQAARRAYEDFLHRRQDPALLEHEAGNEFSARVFPIEAFERKEIIVSYGHELPQPGEAYRLPLRGLPRLGSLEIRAVVGPQGRVEELRRQGWQPDADFEVRPPASGRLGLRQDELVLLRVAPPLPTEPDEIRSLLVLVDTSASRALGAAAQAALVQALVAGLARGAGAAIPLAMACFDQTVELVYEGPAGGFAGPEVMGHVPLGASDLAGALRWAATRGGTRYERVLLVTDGIATAGPSEPDALTTAARALREAGVQRLDVLAAGGIRDDAALRRLVTAGLDRDGTVCAGDLAPRDVAARLTRATRSGIAVQIPGAVWVWPSRLDAMQPGQAALVYAEVPVGQPVELLVGGAPQPAGELGATPRPLLERAWTKARLERLDEVRARPETSAEQRAALQRQIVELSVKHRVLCPHTALLVLESEGDYARYGIDRRALADILTVGPSGLEVLRRDDFVTRQAPKPPAPAEPVRAKKKAMAARPRPEAPAAMPTGMPGARAMEADGLLGGAPSSGGADEGFVGAAAPAEEPMEMLRSAPMMDELLADPAADDDAPSEAAPMREEAVSMPRGEAVRSVPMPAMAAPSFAPAPAPAFMPPPSPGPMREMAAPPPPAPMAAHLEMPEPRVAASRSASPLRRLANAVVDFFTPAARHDAPEPPHPPPPGYAPPPAPEPARPSPLDAWTGRFQEVMALLLAGKAQEALAEALRWRAESPGDVLALVALGEAAEALGDLRLAARAYGSLIDLFPSRADLRRFAGERLCRLQSADALELAIDTFRRAVDSRPDHPSGHRLLAMALLRAGRFAEAFEAASVGQARTYADKFPGVPRILAEDLALCGAALLRADPSQGGAVASRLSAAGVALEDAPSVRFVLVWETDANDVDFHIHDAAGGHAYFRDKVLPSGGELYADVTQGYGPECFTIRSHAQARAYPYRLQAHYYRRGPMGYGMGALQIVEHDGQGGFAFEERPYVVMVDQAFVDLGDVKGPLPIG